MGRQPILLGTLFVEALAFGLVVPVLPEAVARFSPEPEGLARNLGLFFAVAAMGQLLGGPLTGGLSDRLGRRPVLLVSLAGTALDAGLMAFAPTFWLVLAGRAVAGLTGAGVACAAASVADDAPPGERTVRFGRIAAAVSLGVVVGPLVGGVIARIDPKLPFVVSLGLDLANLISATLFWHAPTRSGGRRRGARPPGALGSSFASVADLVGRPGAPALIATFLCVGVAGRAFTSTWALHATRVFGLAPETLGLSFALMGLAGVFGQGVLPKPLASILGVARTVRLGLLMGAMTCASVALATTAAQLLAVSLEAGLLGFVGPILQARLSETTPPENQGTLQGALSTLSAAGGLLGPLLFTALWAASERAPYLVAAAFFVLPLIWTRAADPPPGAFQNRPTA
jgi:DHA1 family tetracycline resistance protein-like MFS transporter